jgi:hypothetical protein
MESAQVESLLQQQSETGEQRMCKRELLKVIRDGVTTAKEPRA